MRVSDSVVVMGKYAEDGGVMLGNYNGIPEFIVTVAQGLRNVCDHVDVVKSLEELSKLEDVDLIVVTIGLNQDIEREGLDREDLLLPADQRALLDGLLAQTDVPVVLTLLSGGGSVDISVYEQKEQVVGVLAVGYGGMFGGQAIAEVIVGDVNPSRRRREEHEKQAADL